MLRGFFSDKDGRDLNPKIMRRPSLRKMKFMRMVCSSTALFVGTLCWYVLVNVLVLVRSVKIAKKGGDRGQPAMYGAHGSLLYSLSYTLSEVLMFYILAFYLVRRFCCGAVTIE